MSIDHDPDAPVIEAARRLAGALTAAGTMVVTAESCTGGLVARALTETGGSSDWFERGFVTYSNDAKRDCLGVPVAELERHGAVSEPVARSMAQGALRASRAGLAIAITGIAGPTGGSPDKPVGTVCFGWATSQRIETTTRRFDGDRATVRRLAAIFALEQAQRLLASAAPTATA